MDQKALFKIGYGLYVLTAAEGGQHNGCIVNTLQQVTDTPPRLSLAVSKRNLTHDMVLHTGRFNVSVLSQGAGFGVYRHFGFQSGREAEKIAGYGGVAYSPNGLSYLTGVTNAYLSGEVFHSVDLGTHTLFLADLADALTLSEEETATYAYYQSHIKPRAAGSGGGWRCRVCGYVYPGEELPADFICPLCKHGAVDFEKI